MVLIFRWIKDMANFKVIYYLVKEQGMTLEGAAKRMKDNITGEDKRVEVISRLTAIKEKLMGIADELGKKEKAADESI